jgi:hypothetical protein
MQRKGDPLDTDLVFLPDPFNTSRTEITPGSDIVGEDFKHNRLIRAEQSCFFHTCLSVFGAQLRPPLNFMAKTHKDLLAAAFKITLISFSIRNNGREKDRHVSSSIKNSC